MWYRFQHPSNLALLKFADAELTPRRAGRVQAHVTVCAACRTRVDALLAASDEVDRVFRRALDPHLSSLAEARTRLERRLSAPQPSPPRARPARSSAWTLAFAASAVVAVALTLWIARAPIKTVDGGQLPNTQLTPGATANRVLLQSMCGAGDDHTNGDVTASLQQRVFHEYGVRDAEAGNFEVDYLVTPGLGGTGSMRNLWPEPRRHAEWNSYVKDQLERYLQQAVCRGEMPVSTAQAALSQDWIASYRNYFHTRTPLPVPGPQTAAGAATQTAALTWNAAANLPADALEARLRLPLRRR